MGNRFGAEYSEMRDRLPADLDSGITEELARNVARIQYGDIPSDIIDIAKTVMLDAVGSMFVGALQGGSRKVLRYVRGLGGAPECTCVYYGDRTNVINATLVNGTFCHGALESVVIPTTLAIAEKELANGHEIITAIVTGWEALSRIAAATTATVPAERPLHPIATFGSFGAAVASGKILRLSDFDMENTLTNCTAQAAGNMRSAEMGSESERLVSGFAASYGLMSTLMAQQGISGARDMLEGKYGFLMCIAGLYGDGTPKYNVDRINEGFGDSWYIRDISTITTMKRDAKFKEQATLAGITKDKQNRVIEILNNIEDQDEISALMCNLVKRW